MQSFPWFLSILRTHKLNHSYAAFILQERNLIFTKTDFLLIKHKFHACSMKQALYPLQKLNIARACQHENTFIQVFCSVPGCQTCMCKRSISLTLTCLPSFNNFWQNYFKSSMKHSSNFLEGRLFQPIRAFWKCWRFRL